MAVDGVVALGIGAKLLSFVDERDLGWVGVRITYGLPDNSIIQQPAVSFVSRGRVPELIRNGIVLCMPELAVEIISPDDTAQAVHKRVLEYLASGTMLVWEVYLNPKTINAYVPQEFKIYHIDDVLDGEDVLPGFTLAVKDIFPA